MTPYEETRQIAPNGLIEGAHDKSLPSFTAFGQTLAVDIDSLRARLAGTSTLRPVGRAVGVTGLMLRVTLAGARVGDVWFGRLRGEPLSAEVVGFADGEAVVVPLGDLSGVGPDDVVESTGSGLE